MGVGTVYPWSREIFAATGRLLQQNRLHHGLLISSTGGLGELDLARSLASLILCHQPADSDNGLVACGQCKSCLLLQAGTHTDLLVVEPEDIGKPIKVDQIRAANHFIYQTSQLRHNKVLLINPADQLNPQAANALLKSLEEPPSGTYLMLITERPGTLLPTLRSRCRQLVIPPATEQQAIDWLSDQGIDEDRVELLRGLFPGAPVKALTLAGEDEQALRTDLLQELKELSKAMIDPLELSARWQKRPLLSLLNWLSLWFTDFCRFSGSGMSDVIRDKQTLEMAQFLASETDSSSLFSLTDDILALRTSVLRQANLNTQLALEKILIHWTQMTN